MTRHRQSPEPVRAPQGGIDPQAAVVSVDAIHPWPDNPRVNQFNVKAAADSIERFGFGSPLIVRKENSEIIAGHTRYLAAKRLGLTTVPVRFMDLSEKDAHLLALADNKIGELSGWHEERLQDLLRELAAGGVDLTYGTGFEDAEINGYLAEIERTSLGGGSSEERLREWQERWQTSEGQLWSAKKNQEHRLFCGDGGFGSNVIELLDGATIDSVITDPPFEIPTPELRATLDRYAKRAIVMCTGRQAFSLCADGWEFRQDYVWVFNHHASVPNAAVIRNHHASVMCICRPREEFDLEEGAVRILEMAREGEPRAFVRPRANFSTLLKFEGESYMNDYFGIAKTEKIFESVLKPYSHKVWADPYLGSAATMIAADNQRKTLYGAERDPATFACAVQRLTDNGFTLERLS